MKWRTKDCTGTIGRRRMSQFIEDLLRPHVLDTSLDAGYQAMAADREREVEAKEWCDALAKDMGIMQARLKVAEALAKELRNGKTNN